MMNHGGIRGVLDSSLLFLDFLVFLVFLSVTTLFPARGSHTASER